MSPLGSRLRSPALLASGLPPLLLRPLAFRYAPLYAPAALPLTVIYRALHALSNPAPLFRLPSPCASDISSRPYVLDHGVHPSF